MELRNYMEKTFPEVALVPNLYKQWDKGLSSSWERIYISLSVIQTN